MIGQMTIGQIAIGQMTTGKMILGLFLIDHIVFGQKEIYYWPIGN